MGEVLLPYLSSFILSLELAKVRIPHFRDNFLSLSVLVGI